ncbi:unnamed protein product, partial [Urochloa humidicola]
TRGQTRENPQEPAASRGRPRRRQQQELAVASAAAVDVHLLRDHHSAPQSLSRSPPTAIELAAACGGVAVGWLLVLRRPGARTRRAHRQGLQRHPLPQGTRPSRSACRDVFAAPATTVPSESAFSTGGRVISDYRSQLTSKNVEALICLQDWLKAEGYTNFKMAEDIDDNEDQYYNEQI